MIKKYNDDYFLNKGFTRFERTRFQSSGVAYNFQKKYLDEFGNKKYFIDIAKYDWTWTDKIDWDYSYEISGQFYKRGTHDAVNMEFISWELEDVEIFLDEMLSLGLIEPYEIGD